MARWWVFKNHPGLSHFLQNGRGCCWSQKETQNGPVEGSAMHGKGEETMCVVKRGLFAFQSSCYLAFGDMKSCSDALR